MRGQRLLHDDAPDRFVLDEDSWVVVEEAEISEQDYETVVKAVRECPTQSLRIEGYGPVGAKSIRRTA